RGIIDFMIPAGQPAIIFNTDSGTGAVEHRLEAVRRHFSSHGSEPPRIFLVSRGSDVRQRALSALEQGYDTLIAAGGDGTVSAVAGVLVNKPATLGVLPLGTYNHFARD